VLQADQAQELPVQAHKPLYEPSRDSASALNESKKSRRFPTMAQEDQAAEEEDVYSFPLSTFINRNIEIMH
jgi:hypothetical protein